MSRECPRECLGHLLDTPGTLSGHFLGTPEPGARRAPETPRGTLPGHFGPEGPGRVFFISLNSWLERKENHRNTSIPGHPGDFRISRQKVWFSCENQQLPKVWRHGKRVNQPRSETLRAWSAKFTVFYYHGKCQQNLSFRTMLPLLAPLPNPSQTHVSTSCARASPI